MVEQDLETLTLKAWLEQIWNAYRRGVPQFGQHAVLVRCMLHHSTWKRYWDSLVMGRTDHDDGLQKAIVHIHNDVTIISQIQSGSPAGVKALSDLLESRGFDEFAIVHTIGVALSEESYFAREHSEEFNVTRYVENAGKYARELLTRPDLTNRARAMTV